MMLERIIKRTIILIFVGLIVIGCRESEVTPTAVSSTRSLPTPTLAKPRATPTVEFTPTLIPEKTTPEPVTETAVHADFQTIVDVYPNKSIYFLELGYPSGAANDSSERQQAAFVQQVFQAWDDHAAHIKLLSFTWLTDIPPGAVDEFTDYYELNNEAFASYLGTLGLRAHDGTMKEAFRILQAEAEARGW